jgi:hypothetical protein
LPVAEAAAHDDLISQLRTELGDEGLIAELAAGKTASSDSVIAAALQWLQ